MTHLALGTGAHCHLLPSHRRSAWACCTPCTMSRTLGSPWCKLRTSMGQQARAQVLVLVRAQALVLGQGLPPLLLRIHPGQRGGPWHTWSTWTETSRSQRCTRDTSTWLQAPVQARVLERVLAPWRGAWLEACHQSPCLWARGSQGVHQALEQSSWVAHRRLEGCQRCPALHPCLGTRAARELGLGWAQGQVQVQALELEPLLEPLLAPWLEQQQQLQSLRQAMAWGRSQRRQQAIQGTWLAGRRSQATPQCWRTSRCLEQRAWRQSLTAPGSSLVGTEVGQALVLQL